VHLGNVSEALVAARRAESFASRAAARVSDTTVMEHAGLVVGFVMVLDDEVDQLYVARTHRGGATAGQLLSAAERRIAAHGRQMAWLAVVPTNTRARRFYERQGWRDAGLFEHTAPGPSGPIKVPCHRYLKEVATPTPERAHSD
jgi:ribosomal protein S18 acetylase RimI-like enzyme